eukprot:7535763-Pyramimonas_sp.AAC.1
MHQKRCIGTTYGCQGASVTLIRGVEVPGMAFRHDSGSSRRNSKITSWRWSSENCALTRFSASGSSNCCLPMGHLPQW